jgi:hypothetical protein
MTEATSDDDIAKQMQAFHAMRDLMAASPGSLENAPDGEKVRLPDAQTKPWEKLGISRATWYRQGKPKWEDQFAHDTSRQKYWARFRNLNIRTIQRWAFVRRYGIDELWQLAYHEQLPCGMLEEIAKWFSHEEQRRFVDRLVELAPSLPTISNFRDDDDKARWFEQFGPVMGVLLHANERELKHVARQVRREIEASWNDATP